MSDIEPKTKKLLDQVRDRIRLKHYAYSTEKKVCRLDSTV
jgi:hypothetical protein